MTRRRLRVAAVAIAISVVLLYSWSIKSLSNPRNANTSAEREGYISPAQTPIESPKTTGLAENHDSTTSTASESTPSLTPSLLPIPTPISTPTPTPTKQCLHYEKLQQLRQSPLSEGKRKFPYSRPDPECRTFQLPALEKLIERMKGVIKDPDLFRLFENSYR